MNDQDKGQGRGQSPGNTGAGSRQQEQQTAGGSLREDQGQDSTFPMDQQDGSPRQQEQEGGGAEQGRPAQQEQQTDAGYGDRGGQAGDPGRVRTRDSGNDNS